MGVQPSQGNSKVKKDQGSHGAHLVNASEKWLCPLCQTPHKDDRGRARKYFFHNTCTVFKSYSAERKSDFCNKHKLCRLCSNKLNSPGHKKPCAHLQRFQCKTCLSQGDSEKALTHHTELHRGGKKQAPVNSQQPAPVNSQLPAPVVPQPLAQPPNAVPGQETSLEQLFIATAGCATSANVCKLF